MLQLLCHGATSASVTLTARSIHTGTRLDKSPTDSGQHSPTEYYVLDQISSSILPTLKARQIPTN